MLTLRLQRTGKSKHATYRLIISEKGRDTQGVYLEQLGIFDPHDKEKGFAPNVERVKFWLERGAQTSDTVHNLLVKAGVVTAPKKKSVFLSGARKKKIEEKKKAVEAKK